MFLCSIRGAAVLGHADRNAVSQGFAEASPEQGQQVTIEIIMYITTYVNHLYIYSRLHIHTTGYFPDGLYCIIYWKMLYIVYYPKAICCTSPLGSIFQTASGSILLGAISYILQYILPRPKLCIFS